MSDVNSKKYSLELLKSQFVLDSESPSGLSWIGKKNVNKQEQYQSLPIESHTGRLGLMVLNFMSTE